MRHAFLIAAMIALVLLAPGCTPPSKTEVLPARTQLERTDTRGQVNTKKVRQTWTVEVGPQGLQPFRLEELAPAPDANCGPKGCPV